MPLQTATPAVMTMVDIAELAHVQRPVVSAWRRRPLASGRRVPFPAAVDTRGGQELFSVADVVEWLEVTGRGNNPDFHADALAHAQPLVALDDEVVRVGLDALLCLKARTGADLAEMTPAAILDEAEDVDPEDDHVVSELSALGDDLPPVAAYVQDLTDAAWDVTSAHALLRPRVRDASASRRSLSGPALRLVGRVGAAMALDLESDMVIVDPLCSDVDVVDAVLTELGEGVVVQVLVVGGSARARAARRHHGIRGRSVLSALPAGSRPLIVTRVPSPTAEATPAAVLTALDDVQLDLEATHRALVLGPAGALCDALGEDALDQERDHLVRLGRLRCALRLPPGLVADGSRQALGLWVLGAEPDTRRIDEQRIAAADLTNVALDHGAVDDVATDAVASLTDHARAAHAFRYARLSATSRLLAGSGPIVPVGVVPERVTGLTAAGTVVRVLGEADRLDRRPTSTPALDGFAIEPATGDHPRGDVALDEAVRAGSIRVLPGTRIAGTFPRTTGGVRVIGTAEIQDAGAPRRGLDPLELEAGWPRARRTEPGDVVFCVSPRPSAIVDDGLSVVASPARVLRCAPGSGLVPEAVARAIRSLPASSPRWGGWRVPRVPAAHAQALQTALRRLAAEEQRARERLVGLDALATDLTHGVASGVMTITPATTTEPTPEGH